VLNAAKTQSQYLLQMRTWKKSLIRGLARGNISKLLSIWVNGMAVDWNKAIQKL
jgi:hypothetical protein